MSRLNVKQFHPLSVGRRLNLTLWHCYLWAGRVKVQYMTSLEGEFDVIHPATSKGLFVSWVNICEIFKFLIKIGRIHDTQIMLSVQ